MKTATKSRPIILPGGDDAIRALRAGRLRAFVVPIPQPETWIDCFVRSASPDHWLPQGAYIRDPTGFLGRGPLNVRMNGSPVKCPFRVGETMWVREAWATDRCYDHISATAQIPRSTTIYTGSEIIENWHMPRQARHMPEWAAQLRVKILSVKAVRVSEIINEEADDLGFDRDDTEGWIEPWEQFRDWWTSTNPACPFEAAWGWLCGIERKDGR